VLADKPSLVRWQMLLTLVPDPLRRAVGARGRGESSFELFLSLLRAN
jgi:hypothetical protein